MEKGNWTEAPGALVLRGGSTLDRKWALDFKALSGPKFCQKAKKEGRRRWK